MNYKQAVSLAGLIAVMSLANMVPAIAAPPPTCTEADTADLRSPGISFSAPGSNTTSRFEQGDAIKAVFQLPVLQYPYDSLNMYGFDLTVVVGVTGRVECALVKPRYRAKGPALNETRIQFLEQVSQWRFEPYRHREKVEKVTLNFSINEEERPKVYIPKPIGDPDLVTITQDMRPQYASYRPYHVELHGDGTAIYTSGSRDDPLGPQSYKVDPQKVKDLIAKAEIADFWSLRDHYRRSPNNLGRNMSFERLNITLGGKTKSQMDYLEHDSGLPETARHLHWEVMQAANIDFWQTPDVATLEQLKANGFDFQSKPAGILLLQMTQNIRVKDEAILALIKLGAPQDAININSRTDEYQNLIGAALFYGRASVASQLIANGALLKEGKPDQKKVDRAFVEAVSSGQLTSVDLILPFQPAMTYSDGDDPAVRVSIIRKLGYADATSEELIAVAQRLIDLGADINTRASDGTTLLHEVFEKEFMLFLLARGGDINALDKEGSTPLAYTNEEEMALLLLERGANPRLASFQLRFHIKHNHWTDVKAWLQENGYADVLVPQSTDSE